MARPVVRCVNLDWLEVYCLEDSSRFPCDADYFRQQGYFVQERDYGTRQYAQAFCIEDEKGEPWIEVRRAPKSGSSEFSGYVQESCNLRVVNRQLYGKTPVADFTAFLLKHGYVFKHIFRIDLCYDFLKFDSGDDPERFARRYIARQYRKINQAKVGIFGDDKWADFEWQTLKWGNEGSMVTTKMYDKTLELQANKTDKSYIKYAWWDAGLVDHPIDCFKLDENGNKTFPHVWRVEFSMKSKARNWLVIEFQGGKKVKKKRIPHRLDMFDTKDKMWERFEELAYHYFRFKKKEYKNTTNFLLQPKNLPSGSVDSKGQKIPNTNVTLELRRKYDCEDKKLFNFNLDREFHQLDQLPKDQKKNRDDIILKRRLEKYRDTHLSPQIHNACQTLIDNLTRDEWRALTEVSNAREIEILQRVLSLKMSGDPRSIFEIANELREKIDLDSIF